MNFWDYIKTEKRNIVLYGKGNGAEKLLDKLHKMGVEVSAVFSSEGFSKAKPFRGFSIMSLEEIKKEYDDFVILLAFGSDREDVHKLIEGVNAEYEMYAPHLPMYDSDYTDSAYFEKNEDRINRVRNMLADTHSVEVFEAVMKFRQSAKLADIWECESDVSAGYELLNLGECETYLDIGAYRGDTVFEFLGNVAGYDKIYAVEPNVKTFEKLKINTAKVENLDYINAFLSDKNGEVTVSVKDGRGSTVSDKGAFVKCASIDGLLDGSGITYIKIDAEGEELNILNGGKKLIEENKPKMRIAAYHKANDIFDIVDKVYSIRSDYKVYLRHYPSVLDWNIDFYFV